MKWRLFLSKFSYESLLLIWHTHTDTTHTHHTDKPHTHTHTHTPQTHTTHTHTHTHTPHTHTPHTHTHTQTQWTLYPVTPLDKKRTFRERTICGRNRVKVGSTEPVPSDATKLCSLSKVGQTSNSRQLKEYEWRIGQDLKGGETDGSYINILLQFLIWRLASSN
jgi:hypothetical protein